MMDKPALNAFVVSCSMKRPDTVILRLCNQCETLTNGHRIVYTSI